MKKVKIHTWHTIIINYDTMQYFYKLESWEYGKIPKYRVFVLDCDSHVYEFTLKCSEDALEQAVIDFCENN